jgi:biopolymer transport protein ExbD
VKFRPVTAELEPDLNMTSLIDVVLLLLIFFMLTTTFVRPSQLSIQLPKSGATGELTVPARELQLSITAKGEFRVNDRELLDTRPSTLEAAIRAVMPEVQGQRVTINADGRASHQAVVTAMEVAGRLGFVEVRISTARSGTAE